MARILFKRHLNYEAWVSRYFGFSLLQGLKLVSQIVNNEPIFLDLAAAWQLSSGNCLSLTLSRKRERGRSPSLPLAGESWREGWRNGASHHATYVSELTGSDIRGEQ